MDSLARLGAAGGSVVSVGPFGAGADAAPAIQAAIDRVAAAGGGIVQGPGLGSPAHLYPSLLADTSSDNYLNTACLVIRDNVEMRDFAFVAGRGVGSGVRNDCRALLIANEHAKMHLATSTGRNVGTMNGIRVESFGV